MTKDEMMECEAHKERDPAVCCCVVVVLVVQRRST